MPQLVGPKLNPVSMTNGTVGFEAWDVWRVEFGTAPPAGVGRTALVQIDTISNSGTVIQNSNFHEIGDNIIAQLGETTGAGDVAWGMGPDGTAGNQPVGTVVKSNFAYRCGLFEKQSSFYFQAKSRANVIEDNIFFHGML